MKNYLLIALVFTVNIITAQNVMNIHQSNGTVLKIPLNTIDSITYEISNPGNLASISTATISSITSSSAISGGSITNDGGSFISQKGVCWSTNPNPTTADNFSIDGSGNSVFTSTINALSINTIYYVRAYAINKAGTSYGNEISFQTTNSNEISGHITSDTTWTADKIYILSGKVVVDAGVTLTIEPGTIIKGAEGSGVNASSLIIAQGGKIMAEGTAAKPIIFTSILDNIQVGQLAGSNLTEADFGKWGGLIILGKAPVSSANGDVMDQIEGIPATDEFGIYGGSDASDNSGVLKYVSIRHGGTQIGAGNEINGLSLGGVGSGTIIENIEIFATLDDGVEFFGGTVTVKNLLVSFQGDDGIDIDQNYAGTVDNFYVISGSGADEGMEVDGPENITNRTGMFTLKNGTCLKDGATVSNGSGDFKDKAQGTLNNVKFGTMKIRANFDAYNSCASKTDTYTHVMATPQTFSTTGTQFDAISVYTSSTCTLPGTYQSDVEGKLTSTSATGCDKSVFANWTIMSFKGKL